MDVAVVGAGVVGTALAVLLRRAGSTITAVSGREETAARAHRHLPGVPVLDAAGAAAAAELILIATPDDAIAETCAGLAAAGSIVDGQIVAHCSGAEDLTPLDPARAAGASRLCLHPLQTFPNVEAAVDTLPGATVAVTADDDSVAVVGERLARDLGAHPIRVAEADKALYHAAAVFASNYLAVVTALAEELFARAGVGEPVGRFVALSRATLDNVATMGPERALTGPAVRGDAGTVARNLTALAVSAPHAVPAYVALAQVALDIGVRAGRLDAEGRAAVEEALRPWR